MTRRQILQKREEFWDTAPAFEGRQEIWDAIRAACETLEPELAQAILDSAGIKTPRGSLVLCYDELGTKYSIPLFCISFPTNLIEMDGVGEEIGQVDVPAGEKISVKFRLSTGKDLTLELLTSDTIAAIKQRVFELENLDPSRQAVMFCGQLLRNNKRVYHIGLEKFDMLQVLVFPP